MRILDCRTASRPGALSMKRPRIVNSYHHDDEHQDQRIEAERIRIIRPP